MSLNPIRIELRVRSTPVLNRAWTKNIKLYIISVNLGRLFNEIFPFFIKSILRVIYTVEWLEIFKNLYFARFSYGV